MEVEQILPGIYLTLNEQIWTPETLRSHGFTHIIRIDKHIASPAALSAFIQPTINDFNSNALSFSSTTFSTSHDSSTTISASVCYEGFETLDLNFGAASHLTTVLPNCYKAVKFIDKALQNGGAVLIIDRVNNEKCITIVVGFLMYKKELKFSNAFQLVKQIHPNLELDRFYVTQLHEYEPILQVQRTFSYGNSCSRELHSSTLKRKVSYDDLQMVSVEPTSLPSSLGCNNCCSVNTINSTNIINNSNNSSWSETTTTAASTCLNLGPMDVNSTDVLME